MDEFVILKALMNKPGFMRYYPVAAEVTELEPEHRNIRDAIADYYRKYDKDKIELDELKVLFKHKYPAFKSDMLEVTWDKLKTVDIHPDLVRDAMVNVVERHSASKIQKEILDILNRVKTGSLDKIERHLQDYKNLVTEAEEDTDVDIKELIKMFKTNKGLMWSVPSLNSNLGHLRLGSLGHVFARPEVGKTGFAVSQLAHWARWIESLNVPGNLLYCTNEETVYVTQYRTWWAFHNITKSQLENASQDQLESWQVDWKTGGGKRIKFVDDATHIYKIEQSIEKYKPVACFIDQGAKVSIPGGSDIKGPEKLQQLWYRYRELGKRHNCAIVTLGQADEKADNQKWIGLRHMDGSKTGLQGELDWALSIGKIDGAGHANTRYCNLCKNKLSGRLGSFTLQYNTEKSMYWEQKRNGK